MKKIIFWSLVMLFLIQAPAQVSAQNRDTVVSGYENISSLFEKVSKSQAFIGQMKGDTIVVDSLPFFWEVSIKKLGFIFAKGGNFLAKEKTSWYSLAVPNVAVFLWNTIESEGTVYTEKYNYELEKFNDHWHVVAIFRKK